MKISFVGTKNLGKLITRLADNHDEIRIASAWGSKKLWSKLALQKNKKLKLAVFGVYGFFTDPDLVDCLVDRKNAYIIDSDNGLFHPKIYYFKSGSKSEAIVGSSNFTNGGFERNTEANLHIKGETSEKVFQDLEKELDRYRETAVQVTELYAQAYRIKRRAAKRRGQFPQPVVFGLHSPIAMFSKTIVNMDWKEYVGRIRSSPEESYQGRICLLREIKIMLSGISRFDDLTTSQWKAFAGVIGNEERIKAGLDHNDWYWFGSMKASGVFKGRIKGRSPDLAEAIDSIPSLGAVGIQDYRRFLKAFHKAFNVTGPTGRVATASRLLAMKRPDVFICVSERNAANAAKALGYTPSTLNTDSYWERLIEPIRESNWYNTLKPVGKEDEADLWEGRVAMLDSIWYQNN